MFIQKYNFRMWWKERMEFKKAFLVKKGGNFFIVLDTFFIFWGQKSEKLILAHQPRLMSRSKKQQPSGASYFIKMPKSPIDKR